MKIYNGSVISCNLVMFNKGQSNEAVMFENYAQLDSPASESGNLVAHFWSTKPMLFNDSVCLIRVNGKFKRVHT